MSVSTDLILIDSKLRTSGNVNNFKIPLIQNLSSGTYLFTSFSITNNFYNVISGENDKVYVEHSIDGNNTLTLTEGKYIASTLLTELKTQLDSISLVIYTITYSSITGKYNISASSGNFKFKFATNTTATSRYLLGKNEVDDIFASSQVSDNPIDLKIHDNIAISILQDNSTHGTLPDGTEFSVLIPVDNEVSFGQPIHYRNNLNYQQFFSFSNSVNSLDIKVYAGDGDLFPMNNTEWVFSIKKYF